MLSTTVVINPRSSVTNRVLKTGEQVEVISSEGGKAVQIKSKPNELGESKVIANVPYDSKGLPIFDSVSKFTTKIEKPKGYQNMKGEDRRRIEMKNSTLMLKQEIENGRVSKNQFTQKQLKDIYAGKSKIDGFTWHHNAVQHIGEGALSEGK